MERSRLQLLQSSANPTAVIPKSDGLVVLDVETSGTNPFVHEILSVALVPLNISALPCVVHVRADQISWNEYAKKNFLKFERVWSESAVAPQEACSILERYIEQTFPAGKVIAVGHNVGFDTAFLRRLAFRAGQTEVAHLSHRTLDTHTMLYLLHSRDIVPASALSSDGAFDYFGVNPPENQRHTALGDALATRDLFFRICDLFSAWEDPPRAHDVMVQRSNVHRNHIGDYAVARAGSRVREPLPTTLAIGRAQESAEEVSLPPERVRRNGSGSRSKQRKS